MGAQVVIPGRQTGDVLVAADLRFDVTLGLDLAGLLSTGSLRASDALTPPGRCVVDV